MWPGYYYPIIKIWDISMIPALLLIKPSSLQWLQQCSKHVKIKLSWRYIIVYFGIKYYQKQTCNSCLESIRNNYELINRDLLWTSTPKRSIYLIVYFYIIHFYWMASSRPFHALVSYTKRLKWMDWRADGLRRGRGGRAKRRASKWVILQLSLQTSEETKQEWYVWASSQDRVAGGWLSTSWWVVENYFVYLWVKSYLEFPIL